MLSLGFKFYRYLFIGLAILLLAFHFSLGISALWIFLPLLCFLTLIVFGSSKINSQFFLKALCTGKADRKQIALSFDDGPHEEITPVILDTLKKYQVKATFFLIGKNIDGKEDIVKRIHEEGHLIGNHSFSHTHSLAFKSVKALKQELIETNKLVSDLTGKEMLYFRPPFGVTSPRIASATEKLHFKNIGWSIRSFDTGAGSAELISQRVLGQIAPGKIILLHDTFLRTNTILENILIYCKNEGVEIVPLDKLLEEKAYVEQD